MVYFPSFGKSSSLTTSPANLREYISLPSVLKLNSRPFLLVQASTVLRGKFSRRPLAPRRSPPLLWKHFLRTRTPLRSYTDLGSAEGERDEMPFKWNFFSRQKPSKVSSQCVEKIILYNHPPLKMILRASQEESQNGKFMGVSSRTSEWQNFHT